MSEQIGLRLNEPYINGALLAVNAVPDAFMMVDGPGCITAKARRIHGPHDPCSTLLDCASEARVRHSGVDLVTIAGNYEQMLLGELCSLGGLPQCGVLLLSAMPLCVIAGTDYERLRAAAQARLSAPVIGLPANSLTSDWLGGYQAVLAALAEGMDLSDPRPEPERVAIVGYFMDRNGGEHRGNVAALEEMLRALELEPAPIWLSGAPYEQLREVRHAKTIISLPHGREAARVLARRLDARLIETALPFGLAGTRHWIEQVAQETGRQAQAAEFVRQQLDRVIPRLQWVVPQAFVNRRIVYLGDPHYARGLAELLHELGASLEASVLAGDSAHLSAADRQWLETHTQVSFQPRMHTPADIWDGLDERTVDLAIANSFVAEILKLSCAWFEWGYPSHYSHYLRDEPFLGFEGCLAFLSRLANAITQHAFRATLRR